MSHRHEVCYLAASYGFCAGTKDPVLGELLHRSRAKDAAPGIQRVGAIHGQRAFPHSLLLAALQPRSGTRLTLWLKMVMY